ncbi:MAG: hypothetical protein ACD_20C00331G0001 [uncultured bacterium]|nr:MAG: hypothetical protein ACD_20C00331G0001 [uncultured bacterium]
MINPISNTLAFRGKQIFLNQGKNSDMPNKEDLAELAQIRKAFERNPNFNCKFFAYQEKVDAVGNQLTFETFDKDKRKKLEDQAITILKGLFGKRIVVYNLGGPLENIENKIQYHKNEIENLQKEHESYKSYKSVKKASEDSTQKFIDIENIGNELL